MTINTIEALPPAPSDRTDPEVYNIVANTWAADLPRWTDDLNTFGTEVQTVADQVEIDADLAMDQAAQAAASAAQAAASAGTAGVILWVSGTTYAINDARSSPIDFQTYRRKTAGAGTTDPSLDSTNWTRVVLGAGTGGAVAASGSVVLTASSGAAQSLTPTNWGQSVTLPNATTCTLSGYFFNFYNNSAYPMRVLDFTGATLGWIASYAGAVLSLSDTSTSAGLWNTTDLVPYAITAQGSFPTSAFSMSGTVQRIVIDVNRTLLLFNTSATSFYGVVYDSSTATWGALTLIRSVNNFVGILSTTNQVLVCSCDAGTAFQAVTLTLSGTTITVNTAATATLAANFTSFGDLIIQNTSFFLGYNRNTFQGLRALTISGTTVTIGAEVVVSGNTGSPHLFNVTTAVALVFSAQSSAGVYATPITVSGSTSTLGTPVTLTTNSANASFFRSFVLGTRWGVVFNGTSDFVSAAVVSVSGTTATSSTMQNVLTSATEQVSIYTDICVFGTKFAIACGTVSNGWQFNIITDTAGVASKGTVLTYTGFSVSSNSNTVLIGLLGSNATFCTGNYSGGVSYVYRATVDLSGTSPASVSTQIVNVGNTSSDINQLVTSSVRNIRSGSWLKGSAISYQMGTGQYQSLAMSDVILSKFTIPDQFVGNSFISGADNESWNFNTATRPVFARVEGVA